MKATHLYGHRTWYRAPCWLPLICLTLCAAYCTWISDLYYRPELRGTDRAAAPVTLNGQRLGQQFALRAGVFTGIHYSWRLGLSRRGVTTCPPGIDEDCGRGRRRALGSASGRRAAYSRSAARE